MRFDRDACVRSLRRVAGGRDEDARGYAASKDAYDREKLVPCCLADAKDIRAIARAVGRGRYVLAFEKWRDMDTFVRDLVPRRTVGFIAQEAAKELEAKEPRGSMAKKKPKAKAKPKARKATTKGEPEHEPATCPCCGEEFPDRDPATEPVYTCGTCGKEGFDCCVPGAGACCAECEE